MEKGKFILENSLLKLSLSNSQVNNYLKGWEKSLNNLNDIFQEDLKEGQIRNELDCINA